MTDSDLHVIVEEIDECALHEDGLPLFDVNLFSSLDEHPVNRSFSHPIVELDNMGASSDDVSSCSEETDGVLAQGFADGYCLKTVPSQARTYKVKANHDFSEFLNAFRSVELAKIDEPIDGVVHMLRTINYTKEGS